MSKITKKPKHKITDVLTKQQANIVNAIAEKLAILIEQRRKIQEREDDLKAELKQLLKIAYFVHNEDLEDTESINTFNIANSLRVTFVDKYLIRNPAHRKEILGLLGEHHPLNEYLRENTKLVFDVTNLNEQDAKKLTTELTKISIGYDVRPTVDRYNYTADGFHNARHVYLDVADNLALDDVLPMQVQVKTI